MISVIYTIIHSCSFPLYCDTQPWLLLLLLPILQHLNTLSLFAFYRRLGLLFKLEDSETPLVG
jgi:hypothetical protein